MFLNIFISFTKNKHVKSRGVLHGALILSVGSVLAKIFSAIYRIGLTRILGGEGIGLYQLIFPFYSLCVVLVSAGVPMAVSKIVAKYVNADKQILKRCFIYAGLAGLTLTFILVISCGALSELQGDGNLTFLYLILAPSVLLVGFSSVLKGYFQGKHNFIPSAISNILEQFAKFSLGLILSFVLINVSLMASIVGAVVGIVVSEFVSVVILLIYLKKYKIKTQNEIKITYFELIKEILPIMATNLILPISSFIDSVLVVNLLKINFSNRVSTLLYGLESGAVSSLVSLPTIFSFAIASVILPNLVTIKNNFNKSNKLMLATKIILIISIPCVLGFLIIPERLITVLYNTKLNSFGIDGVKIASRLLSLSSFGVVFLALNQLFSSSLQAIDKSNITIRNLILAVVVKFVLELLFMPSLVLNIYVLAISNSICYIIVMVLNFIEIRQFFKFKLNYIFAAKLVLCNAVMIISMLCVLMLGAGILNTILAVMVAAITYFISLYFFNIFSKKDRAMLKYKV